MNRFAPGEKGVALALVLWLVVLLGAVAATVVASTRSASNIVLNARARAVGRYAAESGIVAGVAALEQRIASEVIRPQHVLPFDGMEQELARLSEPPLGNARFVVALTNLNARLDLNQTEPETLVGLFSQFTSRAAAWGVVDALQDWRDADDLVRPQGAERDTYLRAGSPYLPPNAPLSRSDELPRIRGVTEALALAVAPYITVNGDSRIDVNAAPEAVLAAVPEIGPAGARILVSRRRNSPFTSTYEVQNLLRRGRGQAIAHLGVTPKRLLLVSRGWMAGHPLTHEIQAVYTIVSRRLQLRSWRERDL
jgi:general secretion pathway protein K